MCGIIGYIGSRNCYPILLKGLKRLEYRGYDSCGIATINNKKINIIKTKGRIKNLEEKLKKLDLKESNIGIAHTRWATHGIPDETNSHPHTDCTGSIAIVHNGIIENYEALKKYLTSKGHNFKSETDSEIIAHLIEEFYKKDNDFIKAIRKALSELTGTFGLAIINKNINKIFVARRGSPIIIGIGHNEFFIASDVSAIIEHTKNIIYLDDNELIELDYKNYKITNLKDTDKEIIKEITKVTMSLKEIEKGDFKHFMLKEIFEQPTTIRNALSGRIDFENLNSKLGGIGEYKEHIYFYENLQKIVIVACGTSYHCALVSKYFIEKYLRIPVEAEFASEFRYKNPIINKNTLVIPISQSGETADTLGALTIAKEKKSKLLGIVNTVASTIARECGEGIHIRAGVEIGVASTKAFTNQLVAIYLLTIYIGRITHKIDNLLTRKLFNSLTRLPNIIEEMLKENNNIKIIANKYKDYKNIIFLGRGINYPIALEGALKLKEISYINSQAYAAGEMKHGPLAIVDNKTVSIVIANKNHEYEKMLSTINEIKSRSGKIICITNKNNLKLEGKVDDIIYIPTINYDFEAFINVVVLQLFAYNVANLNNCEIDKPRNLAKSVTVE